MVKIVPVKQNKCETWSNFLRNGWKVLFCFKSSQVSFLKGECDTESVIFEDDDLPPDNGYNLCGVVVPETILEFILHEIQEEDILSCSQVCHTWKNLIARNHFWQTRFEYKRANLGDVPSWIRDKPEGWRASYSQLRHEILSKSYIGNPSGQRGLDGWAMWDNVGCGHGWRAKQCRLGSITSNDIPSESFYFDNLKDWCSKYYIVDLWRDGLTPTLMKLILPFRIHCSQLYGAKCNDFDSVGLFNWELRLLNSEQKLIAKYSTNKELFRNIEWRKAEHSFNFGRGALSILDDLRYVIFIHGGDQLYYGIKLARSLVKIECLDKEPETDCVEQPAGMEEGGAMAIEAAWPNTTVNGWMDNELGTLALK